MIVAYLKKDGVNFYEIKEGKIIEISQESLSKAKFFSKNILLVSKELLFYTRRRYPPTPLNKLKKAIKIEIPELFPVSNLDYTIKVFESTDKVTVVDIWAWSKDEYEKVLKIFPFQYVIPEDLLFLDEDSCLKIFHSKDIYHLIACSKGKFLGTLSVVSLTQKDIELFLAGLSPYSEEIEKIKIYGDILKEISFEKEIERIPAPSYPLCLERIPKIDIKEFKVRSVLPLKTDLLFRIPIYALFGYSVFLFFTVQHYDSAINNLKSKISELDKKIASLEGKAKKDYTSLISEANNKISETVSPLTLMNELAQKIPVGCTVNRFVLNEKNLEITMSFEAPLDVLETFESSSFVKSVKMKGAPIKRTGTKAYDFTLTVELNSE